MDKKTALILFGGQSSEHEVSLRSAKTFLSGIDNYKYYVLSIGITKNGQWLLYSGTPENLKPNEWEKYASPAIISPDATKKSILKLVGNIYKEIPIDFVIPILHGKYGEDGTLQGLLELAQIPYVGSGVLASSVCMDKEMTKLIASHNNIPQAKYIASSPKNSDDISKLVDAAKDKLGFPCFVKPANAGSSVGVTKAETIQELFDSIYTALEHDSKIIIEEAISGRELECAVLGNTEPKASGVGEIISSADFYDYDSKYNSDDSKTILNPDLDEEIIKEIQEYSKVIFKATGCKGFARVDFFLEHHTNRVIFNEINTIPGFTSISMYPMLWEKENMPINKLIDELIRFALEPFETGGKNGQ